MAHSRDHLWTEVPTKAPRRGEQDALLLPQGPWPRRASLSVCLPWAVLSFRLQGSLTLSSKSVHVLLVLERGAPGLSAGDVKGSADRAGLEPSASFSSC